jgi:phytoene dehydrogenase-like protein
VRAARLFGRLPRLRTADVLGRSAAEWFAEQGLDADALGLVTTLARTATYVAEMDRLPAGVALAQMQLALGPGVLYLHGGWQQLVDGLVVAANERGATTIAADPVVAVAPTPGGWVGSTAAGRRLTAPAVVLAAGSPAASAALLGTTPWGSTGPDVTAACLDVAATAPATPPVVFGVGSPLYLSTHCPPAELAPPDTTVVAVMRYRDVDETGEVERDREELRSLRRMVGIGDADVVHERYLHRMTVVHGLPDPHLGLPSRPPVAVAPADGLFLAGDWVGPTGWLADASLASGEAAGLLAASCAALVRPG